MEKKVFLHYTQAELDRNFDQRGWAQILPDPDEPLVHIYAEGRSEEESEELEAEFRSMVEEIMESEEAAVTA